ncbi:MULTISPECIES: ABC transporter permease [Rhodomicrobium]|uniref:ABC transporter permease n=1 Tax=Rhodomicrobium TaxID=1068 RepID=UPI001AED0DDB|nr:MULTISPECIES: ABC transporter permease [Rhodomicrobium]
MADDSAGVVAHQGGAETFAQQQTGAADAPVFRPPGRKFLELRHEPSRINGALLGLIGAALFIGLWEAGHYLTPEEGRQFLPSVGEVIYALIDLFREQNFLDDVIASCIRISVSFFAAAAIAVPLGVLMGSFKNLRALLNPTLSAWKYLPAASFMPLLLVWFGPTDTAKLALLFIGVVFFLVALVLDNAEAVPSEFTEAALTMGASRWEVVLNVIVPAAAPAIFDSMRNMIAVGWTYLVIAEIVGARDGIGAMMMRAGRTLSVDQIMAGILTIGILGVLTDILFRMAARLLLPWATSR